MRATGGRAARSLVERHRAARAGLFVLGAAMCVGPSGAVLALGWITAPLLTLTPLGVLLAILAVFHSRISGTIKFGRFFEVPIAPPREGAPRAPTPTRQRVRGSG